jgi:negative regulator of sigma-B (phosphoserine phosphatase)
VTLAISSSVVPARGEHLSGDCAIVREEPGVTLIAVIDVLGHGPEAAKVADLGSAHLRSIPIGTARELMHSLHERLRGTRGAAAAICVLRDRELTGCGVGNVEVRVLGTSVPTVLTPGILGQRTHELRQFAAQLSHGDRIVFFTDGISSRVPLSDLRTLPPAEACRAIMHAHRRPHDDATVVVADLQLPRPRKETTR